MNPSYPRETDGALKMALSVDDVNHCYPRMATLWLGSPGVVHAWTTGLSVDLIP